MRRACGRITLFLALLDLLVQSVDPVKLASAAYRADPRALCRDTHQSRAVLYRQETSRRSCAKTETRGTCGDKASVRSRDIFRRHTGLPFVQYVNRLRINLACQLLMSGELNITDICYQVGFNNLSNFNRQFLLLKDMSPSRWARVSAAQCC